jgi:hypothetical protein
VVAAVYDTVIGISGVTGVKLCCCSLELSIKVFHVRVICFFP